MDSLKTTSGLSPIILRDNFLNDTTLSWVLDAVKKERGTFSRDGYNHVKTIRDNMDPRYCETKFIKDGRNILKSMWYSFFWPQIMEDIIDSDQAIYQHAFLTKGYGDHILLSVYGDGDSYGEHIDIDMDSIITAVLMLSFGEPKFTGGSLVVSGFEVPFVNNRLVVFPSCFPHEVTKIDNESDKYVDKRFTVQYFCSAVRVKNPLIDESSNIQ